MKAVFVGQSPAEAHLAAGLLAEAGIRHAVLGDALFGVRGEIGFSPSSLPTVVVADDDEEAARAVLADRGGASAADDPPGDAEARETPAVVRPRTAALVVAALAAAVLGAALFALRRAS